MKIKHHNETIAHLRAETHQWKAQLSRLEETSRQEIADWKEQYLHAEQDRCHLSSRINELVAEQLAVSHLTSSCTALLDLMLDSGIPR